MSRLELDNGDWVDFDDRLNYAQAMRIRLALGSPAAEGTFVAALVRQWALRDTDGNAIEFPGRSDDGVVLEALNRLPFDTFQAMAVHAAEKLEGVPDPKGTSGTSTGSAQGSRSASRRSSTTPTSSNGIQAGLGPISDQHLPT